MLTTNVDPPELMLEMAINASAEDDNLSIRERNEILQMLQQVEISPNELIDYSFFLADQIFLNERRRISNWQREFVLFAGEWNVRNVPKPFLSQGVWFSPGPSIRAVLIESIRDAKLRVEVCIYNLTDDRLATALIDAVKRRVVVTVLTERASLNQAGSDIPMLRKAGVKTHPVDRGSNRLMHHKYAIFDRQFVLSGSYNWTSGASKNDENLLLVNETERVSQYVRNFESMVQKFRR